jgi:hypothetical protein
VLFNEHIQFHHAHRQLLKAQVILYDTTQKLAQAQTELAAAQKHTDENLAALINVVDSGVRQLPPPY